MQQLSREVLKAEIGLQPLGVVAKQHAALLEVVLSTGFNQLYHNLRNRYNDTLHSDERQL